MATSAKFRELLIDVLKHPKDRERGYALAQCLERQKHPRAEIIQRSFRENCAFFNAYSAHGADKGYPPVVLIVIQLIPQPVAVEFACCCIETVVECLEEVIPMSDERPANVLETIRAWANGQATKRAVADASTAFSELARRASINSDEGEDEEEQDAIARAWCACEAIGWVAAAVQQSPNDPEWWHCISGCLGEVHYASDDKNLPKGQRKQLIQLIESRDLGM